MPTETSPENPKERAIAELKWLARCLLEQNRFWEARDICEAVKLVANINPL